MWRCFVTTELVLRRIEESARTLVVLDVDRRVGRTVKRQEHTQHLINRFPPLNLHARGEVPSDYQPTHRISRAETQISFVPRVNPQECNLFLSDILLGISTGRCVQYGCKIVDVYFAHQIPPVRLLRVTRSRSIIPGI